MARKSWKGLGSLGRRVAVGTEGGACADMGALGRQAGCTSAVGGGGLQAGQWSPGGSGLSRHKAELEPRVGELGGVSLGRVAGPGGG